MISSTLTLNRALGMALLASVAALAGCGPAPYSQSTTTTEQVTTTPQPPVVSTTTTETRQQP
jgi:hypothetical protein